MTGDLLGRHRAALPDWLALYYRDPLEITHGEGRHARVPHVREVRGRGLMIGVELTRPGTDLADPDAASAVLEAARAGGLLLAKGGGHDTSALRIAPPLSLTVAEAEAGAEILDHALRSLTQ